MTAKLSWLTARRNRQPIVPTGIDLSSAFAKSLIYAFNGATGRDEANGRRASNFRKAACSRGLGHQVTGADEVGLVHGAAMPTASIVTLFAFIDHQQPAGAWSGIIGKTDSLYISGTRVGLGFDSLNYLNINHPGGNYPVSISAISLSGVHSYAVVLDGTNADGYIDGIFSYNNTVPDSSIPANSDAWRVGSYNGTYDEPCVGKHLVHAAWLRALGASEIRALHANPWQLFAPDRIPFFTPVVTAQYARPVSDVSAGTWTASTGSDLFAMLDETSANDSDYIVTTGTSTCEVALGSLTDPGSSNGHIVRYRISATSGGIIVRLRQGTTTIATWTHASAPSSLTTYEQTLTGGEADSISDYSALRLQFEATT